MKRGYTLVEVMVVIAIIAVTTAIAYPAFSSARAAARVSSSADRLRQLHLAVEIYRNDWGANNDLDPESFPSHGYVYWSFLGLGKDFFRSPCGYKTGIEDNLMRLSYQYVPAPEPVFTAHLRRYGPDALLFRDPHCSGTVEAWNTPQMTKRVLAVTVGGQLINRMKRGSTLPLEWWVEP
jgi:prepilin-type N-terminal cleavage/methylation domain-containing protein